MTPEQWYERAQREKTWAGFGRSCCAAHLTDSQECCEPLSLLDAAADVIRAHGLETVLDPRRFYATSAAAQRERGVLS